MIIQDIKQNRISPFEIEDLKLKKLFSFYLHWHQLLTVELRLQLMMKD